MQVHCRVVDLSHHNGGLYDFNAAKTAGIWGVIYKATEDTGYVDETYAAARQQARAAGILWGAYHFFRPGNVDAQVAHFLDTANPDQDTLLVLDHEDEGCSLDSAKRFMQEVEARTGQRPAIYSGHLIKEQLGNRKDEYLAEARLWMAQYGSNPEWPPNWDQMWLWQYTDGVEGPSPHSVPGIGNCDCNSFQGTKNDLENSWGSGHWRPQISLLTAVEIAWIQATLNLIDNAGLDVDGEWGPLTQGAVKDYQSGDVDLLPATGYPTKGTVAEMLVECEAWNTGRTAVEVS